MLVLGERSLNLNRLGLSALSIQAGLLIFAANQQRAYDDATPKPRPVQPNPEAAANSLLPIATKILFSCCIKKSAIAILAERRKRAHAKSANQ
jgi:hypothetical protein